MVALIGGRPEVLNLKDMLRAFTDFREEVVGRRTKFLLRKARDRAHILVGLAIAVANIDEVIALIRKAPDPATAREQLMARDWPAKDVVALVELIADPRHKVSAEGTVPAVRGAGPRHSRASPAAPDRARPRRGRPTSSTSSASRSATISTSCGRRARIVGDHQGRARRDQGRVRHAAPHRDHRDGRRGRGRRPDPARGHGRHRQPQGLHQARAAVRLPRPAPRRQGPRRHGDPRRGFRHPHLRRQHAHAGAVLLLARHGLQDEGLAAAAGGARRRAARRWSICCRSARTRRITTILPLPEDEAPRGRSST